ncbi:hypothetical protein [Tsukamurella soli]|uniref:Uncharacterized protein n=1 Tax=Tsukamurella soli TaxID=644556 RepID=A0ABP8J351_9ACTN
MKCWDVIAELEKYGVALPDDDPALMDGLLAFEATVWLAVQRKVSLPGGLLDELDSLAQRLQRPGTRMMERTFKNITALRDIARRAPAA